MIHHGDLFDVLPTLSEASIDACVTDPPYGIGFMGREWDTFKPESGQKRIVPNRQINSDNPNLKGRTRGPASSPSAVGYDYTVEGLRGFQSWSERWAREVHRVLKPGAFLVVCGAPRSYHRMACGLEDAGFVVRDCFAWIFGQGFPKNYNLGNGRGTALKPAHEQIALAWKPFKGSIKGCHAAHGTAALNVEACRISSGERPVMVRTTTVVAANAMAGKSTGATSNGEMTTLGRWPSNVLLDEEAAKMLDEQSGDCGGQGKASGPTLTGSSESVARGRFNGVADTPFYGDTGGASRFFYVAKPSRQERDYGVDRNIHPTVKPVELMRWLVRLVTPINGTVLDPFTGSGTTGMACRYELRNFIGIEREAEYVAIAERRIAQCVPLFGEATA